jgi:deazaflavin-dependent oxidoreductase (nitroreductase family)
MDKRRIASASAKYAINPVVKAAIALRIPVGPVLLETIGRKSGRPRRTPVGGRLEGNTVWLVAEHGLRAAYVCNIQANPRVRVRIGRHWRTGTAHPLPDDDWRARLRMIGRGQPLLWLNSTVVRVMKTTPASVRIDLD